MRVLGFRMPDSDSGIGKGDGEPDTDGDVDMKPGPVTIDGGVLIAMKARQAIANRFRADVMETLGILGVTKSDDALRVMGDAVQNHIVLKSDVTSLTDLLSRAEEEIDTLRTRLDNALHAAYRLASVACDISGADMQAVQRAADKCGCDHEDSPEPHNPRRQWREG